MIRSVNISRDYLETVSNLVSNTHQHDMQVFSEGVETPRGLKTVIALGEELIQGYSLGRPNRHSAYGNRAGGDGTDSRKEVCG